MAVTKPSHLSSKMWANTGSLETPDDVKIDSGWVAEVPKSQVENWVQNRQDRAIGHINERGIAEWDASTDYLAGKSYVQDSSGTVYRAVQNTGPSTAPQNPATDIANTYWTVAFSAGELDTYTKAQADERFLHYEENGVNVLDQINGKQDSSPNLSALSSLMGAADRLPYFTDAEALSLATITAAARTLLAATNAAGQRDALGLGTAATAALTSSRTDTTSGRVPKVGDFGIGVSTQDSPTITDFAAENPSGIYKGVTTEVANGAPDFPANPLGFTAVCTVYNQDRMYWVLFPTAGGWVGWWRESPGVMTWRRLHDSNNQLSIGTTAASARTALGLGSAATWNSVPNASPTVVGGLKARLDGTTLYLTNNGNNA